MNFRWLVFVCLVTWSGLIGRAAFAASYQKTDGTIVDPMASADCNLAECIHPSPFGSPVHPFIGPLLAPGVKVSGSDLSRADLRDADLREADLRDVILGYSDVSHGDLRGADLRNTNRPYTNFSDGDLNHADLNPRALNGDDFCATHLDGANLHGARLRLRCGCSWEGGSIVGADFSGARLRGSSFRAECNLGNNSFENADLRNSSFSEFGVVGSWVNMNGADLRGTFFNYPNDRLAALVLGTPFYDSTTRFGWYAVPGFYYEAPASWINLDLVDTDSDGTADSTDNCRFAANADQADSDTDQIGNTCDFSPSTTCLEMGALAKSTTSLVAFQDNTCEDWSWVEQPAAYLQSAVLTEAYLRSANLSGSVMANVDLAGADLTAARLINAYMANSNLRSAILAYAHLAFADLTGANLAHADLEAADLANTRLTSAQYDEATVFPSGRNVSEPPWNLPNDVTPWNAGMVPVPEPSVGLLVSIGALGIGGLAAIRGRARPRQEPVSNQARRP